MTGVGTLGARLRSAGISMILVGAGLGIGTALWVGNSDYRVQRVLELLRSPGMLLDVSFSSWTYIFTPLLLTLIGSLLLRFAWNRD